MKALSSYTSVLLLPQTFSFPNYTSPFRGVSSNLTFCAQVAFPIMFENRCTPQVWHGSTPVCHRVLLAFLWLEDCYQAWLLVKTEQGREWDGPAMNQICLEACGVWLWGSQTAVWDPCSAPSRGRSHVIIQALTREEADIHESKHTEMLLTNFTLVSFIAWRTNAFSQIETRPSIETGCCTVCWNK